MNSLSHHRTRSHVILLATVSVLAGFPAYGQHNVQLGDFERLLNGSSQTNCSSNVSDLHVVNSACSGSSNGYTFSAAATTMGRTLTSSASQTGIGTALNTEGKSDAYVALFDVPTFLGPAPSVIFVYYTSMLSVSMSAQGLGIFASAKNVISYNGGVVGQDVFINTTTGALMYHTSVSSAQLDSSGGVFRASFDYLSGARIVINSESYSTVFNRNPPDAGATGAVAAATQIEFLGIEAIDANGNSLNGQTHCTFARSGESCDLLLSADDESTSTPEPATATLLLSGLLGLGTVARRHARQRQMW